MERLLGALGNPQKKLRCLHVAGTNGKGSVSAFAESILRSAGHRAGLYTSPHLVRFGERIRVNGEEIAPGELEEGILRVRSVLSGCSEGEMPTFFELATAIGFDHFARSGCEVVVLETGLGGRLDATNVAEKAACAITPLALDHTEWLGKTIGDIAREKAGILRRGVPAVIAPQEAGAEDALRAAASAAEAPCKWIRRPIGKEMRLGLAGDHQRWNAALAVALVEAAGFRPTPHELLRGLSEVEWPGRFQRLDGGSLVLDGAHNLHAAERLVETWRSEYGAQRCRLVFGALCDKSPEEMLSVLEAVDGEILLVPVASPRSVDPAKLAKGVSLPISRFDSLKEALQYATQTPDFQSGSPPRAPILVTGSLFLVGEALAIRDGSKACPRIQ